MSELNNKAEPHFSMQKIYLKGTAFESPHSAAVFSQDWKPRTTLELDVQYEEVDSGRYEVVLTVSLTARNAEQLAFTLEVEQAALFLIQGFPEDQLQQALGAACPSVMFPYLRENVDHLLVKGGYPALTLAPVNFDAMYREQRSSSAA
ncbi:protein-export protein SecB [Marinobacterium zhoushanense]|uniref:Protein-export protein SecB n=1 Tax=Marinobacterium zhoushanense TaxID=1679163 RepID=A0ABQ1KFI9_9GAMM|nr:protein-export chaperone SecB [Marinobacterium zhoushanense]GGB95848.1 protein-export protein SecB [Marinobacterium zhoushanense]